MDDERQRKLMADLLTSTASDLVNKIDTEGPNVSLKEAACIDLSPGGRSVQIQLVVTDIEGDFLDDFLTVITRDHQLTKKGQ